MLREGKIKFLSSRSMIIVQTLYYQVVFIYTNQPHFFYESLTKPYKSSLGTINNIFWKVELNKSGNLDGIVPIRNT